MAGTERASNERGWWSRVLHQPRRVWLRRAMFQVHLWSGLLVGLMATVVGVSGSAIVYREELDRRLAPALYRVQAGPALSADALLADVARQMPGLQVQSFDVEDERTPWLFRGTVAGQTRTAFVDGTNGRLLGVRGDRDGAMNWLAQLHFELLGGKTGTWVNGVGAAGLLLLCVTGIVVWWPGRGKVRRSLRIHRPGRWRRFNWDMHTAGGFWISLPLAVQAFTGVYLCFGLGIAMVVLGGKAAEFNELVSAPGLAVACTSPYFSLQKDLEQAGRLHNGAKAAFVELPSSPTAPLTVYSRTLEDARTGRIAVMAFDPCTSAMVKHMDSAQGSWALRTVLWLDAFHFGLAGGWLTRVLWVPLGLAPGVLFLTGFLLWWRRVGARLPARFQGDTGGGGIGVSKSLEQ